MPLHFPFLEKRERGKWKEREKGHLASSEFIF